MDEIEFEFTANKKNIKKWIDALRSGKYRQTHNKLSDGRDYCCLGVACEVAIENGVDIKKRIDIMCNSTRVTYDKREAILPESVISWLGVNSEDPRVVIEGTNSLHAVMPLSVMNDKKFSNFNDIARFIEDTYVK